MIKKINEFKENKISYLTTLVRSWHSFGFNYWISLSREIICSYFIGVLFMLLVLSFSSELILKFYVQIENNDLRFFAVSLIFFCSILIGLLVFLSFKTNSLNLLTNSLTHWQCIWQNFWILLPGIIFLYFIGVLMVISLLVLFKYQYDLTTIFYSIGENLNLRLSAIFLISTGIFIILVNNPIYNLLNLIFIYVLTTIYLISIQLEFLAYLYLIIYIGAVSILFLFVIMLFNLKSLQSPNIKKKNIMFLKWSLLIFICIFFKFFYLISFSIKNLIENVEFYQIMNLDLGEKLLTTELFIFGQTFYTYYWYIFIILGIILLVSMIGSIVLALSTIEPKISSLKKL